MCLVYILSNNQLLTKSFPQSENVAPKPLYKVVSPLLPPLPS